MDITSIQEGIKFSVPYTRKGIIYSLLLFFLSSKTYLRYLFSNNYFYSMYNLSYTQVIFKTYVREDILYTVIKSMGYNYGSEILFKQVLSPFIKRLIILVKYLCCCCVNEILHLEHMWRNSPGSFIDL